MEKYVSLKNVSKVYRMGEVEIRAVDGIDFDIEKGEFVVIVGPSGAGKTTVLNILGGMDTATSGQVLVDGSDIAKYSQKQLTGYRRDDIGFVFQFYNLIPNLSVEENILLPLLLDGRKKQDYKSDLEYILEVVGLSHRRRHTPRELSGGQQQRVAIARALISRPEILFADEPTGNLDTKTGEEIMALLQEINQTNGQTILMVTHSPEAAKSSSRIITVRDGVIC